jgi:hypothetical protein
MAPRHGQDGDEPDDELDGVVKRENGESAPEPGEPTQPHRRTAERLERHARDASDPAVPVEPSATRPAPAVDPPETG